MRCYICNRALSLGEIILDKKTNKYKPCSTCLDEIHYTIAEDVYNDWLMTRIKDDE
jgi:hypothetical protein|tara:strand:+ start:2320 stop:2487 length:168 start_codon:yes stop_codon:yes gene_type:complete